MICQLWCKTNNLLKKDTFSLSFCSAAPVDKGFMIILLQWILSCWSLSELVVSTWQQFKCFNKRRNIMTSLRELIDTYSCKHWCSLRSSAYCTGFASFCKILFQKMSELVKEQRISVVLSMILYSSMKVSSHTEK